ncbi:MAG TPA: DUF2510 domain-containing protein [Mycobacteriales bacterium]|nr:DUF2510 domain-containing protein [Mycobacteriales bacterium]
MGTEQVNATGEQGGPPPAGWYPNPDGTPSLRWWSGVAWTGAVNPLPSPPSTSDVIARVIIGLALAFVVFMLIVGGVMTATGE